MPKIVSDFSSGSPQQKMSAEENLKYGLFCFEVAGREKRKPTCKCKAEFGTSLELQVVLMFFLVWFH